MGKGKGRGGVPGGTPGGTPGGAAGGGTTPQPVKWGAIDLPVIAGRLGIAPDSSPADVADALARMNVTPQQMAQFVLDGQSALDFIDGNTPTVSNIDPDAAATDVDLDDAEPPTKRMTPEELEAYLAAAVRGAGSGATRDLRFSGGGVTVSGNYRRPMPEGDVGGAGPDQGDGKKGGKAKKSPPPKKGDPGYFAHQDAQADRKWREMGREPPPGVGVARWAKRNPEKAAILGLGIGGGVAGVGYGIKSAVDAYMAGQQQGQQQEQGKFRRAGDDQLLQQQDMELRGVPAGAAPAGQQTMQAPANDAASLLMRIRQSRSI